MGGAAVLRQLALAGAALVALQAAPSAAREDRSAEIVLESRRLLSAGRPQEAAGLLESHLRRAVGDREVHDLLGQALSRLGRRDEAAHAFERALELAATSGGDARAIRRRLESADRLAKRRGALLRRIVKDLGEVAERLSDGGDRARALRLLEGLATIAAGEDLGPIRALADGIRAAETEVDLDRSGAGERPEGGWPLVESESEHYRLACNLEPEVTRDLGRTMDDIHAYYVRIYFDGDERKVSSRKPTIRVHESHASMLREWQGETVPGGWWSPGEWRVVTYDTRTDSGSLDGMLEILFHEASHHFMTLVSRGAPVPSWLNEGTATFFEGARAMADRRVLWPDAAPGRLRSLRAMLAGEGGPTLADVVGYAGAGSYEPSYYPWGWGLVYFLQQYEDPVTFEYVYRPLYSRYRQEIASRGGDPRQRFDQVFLGKESPRGHGTFEDFERDWRAWILDEVHPLHFGARRRELRMGRVQRYLEAARAASGRRRAPVAETELLLRALGDVEYVRTRIDPPDRQDPDLLLLQADLLERLERPEGAAPLIEELLEISGEDQGGARRAELEARLAKLDRANAPLRIARSRARALAREVGALLDAYAQGAEPMVLRRYTLASSCARVLFDQPALEEAAERLRQEAREKGLLRGALYVLEGPAGAWKTIFSSPEEAFEPDPGRLAIEAVRPAGRILTEIPVQGEYELRARLVREGDIHRSSFHGIVVSGTAGGDWMVIGLDGQGRLMLRRLLLGEGGGVTDSAVEQEFLDPRVTPEEDPEIAVRVRPDGRISVRIGERAPREMILPLPVPATGHVGIYAKDGRTVLEDAVVEILP